jgi:hypothetical protein
MIFWQWRRNTKRYKTQNSARGKIDKGSETGRTRERARRPSETEESFLTEISAAKRNFHRSTVLQTRTNPSSGDAQKQ